MIRVLVVEDDPIFAKLVQVQLRTLGEPRCEVVHAASLAAARERLAGARFDVILTDLGLPDSQGPATADAIEAAAPGTPIVVLSGSEEPPRGRRFLLKGGIGAKELADALRAATGVKG